MKNYLRNKDEKDQKVIKVNEVRYKLMKMISGTIKYDMGWWMRCTKNQRLMYGTFYGIASEQQTHSMPVVGTQEVVNGEMGKETKVEIRRKLRRSTACSETTQRRSF